MLWFFATHKSNFNAPIIKKEELFEFSVAVCKIGLTKEVVLFIKPLFLSVSLSLYLFAVLSFS
jgi:hypothetical protein